MSYAWRGFISWLRCSRDLASQRQIVDLEHEAAKTYALSVSITRDVHSVQHASSDTNSAGPIPSNLLCLGSQEYMEWIKYLLSRKAG
jgi:hypothetical protein